MQSSCIVKLSPAVAAVSKLLNADIDGYNDEFSSIIQKCINNPGNISQGLLDTTKQKIDDKILCELMCCCTKNPCIGRVAKTKQKQSCVDATLTAADAMLGFKSRYKSEFSYNMAERFPKPFMHRDELGQNTLEKSRRWQTRAKQDIPGYKGGEKDPDVRRPDVIIVKDPSIPPNRDNIDRVVEMKFKNDPWGYGQAQAYERIAGGSKKLIPMEEGGNCNCSEDDDGDSEGKEKQLLNKYITTLVPLDNEDQSIDWGAAAETVGMGALTAFGAIATAALFLVPVDGPVGEAVAGSATAAAAARTASAFGRIFKYKPQLAPAL